MPKIFTWLAILKAFINYKHSFIYMKSTKESSIQKTAFPTHTISIQVAKKLADTSIGRKQPNEKPVATNAKVLFEKRPWKLRQSVVFLMYFFVYSESKTPKTRCSNCLTNFILGELIEMVEFFSSWNKFSQKPKLCWI